MCKGGDSVMLVCIMLLLILAVMCSNGYAINQDIE